MVRSNLVLLLTGLACYGQEIQNGSLSTNKYHVVYRCVLEPRGEPSELSVGGGVATKNTSMHRHLEDRSRKQYTGYDIVIEPGADRTLQVTFKPLSLGPEKLGLPNQGSGWSPMALPKYPPPQTIQQGDTIALDLMVHPMTKQRIVDYLTISSSDPAVRYYAAGSPRDFRAEDAELRLADPEVTVNGKVAIPSGHGPGALTGSVLWFYIPGKGRYVLSVVPNARLGFRKAGEIRGAKASFQWNGEAFECSTKEQIAPASGVWNLYVYHDPSVRENEYTIGAADAAESMVKAR